ncbi:MAG TPA: hypothetical protein VIK11_13810 [Tepidiformaceae bacterium]
MTAKESLRQLIDEMSDEEAQELLAYLNLLADPDVLTESELAKVVEAEAAIERGEFLTLTEVRARYGVA